MAINCKVCNKELDAFSGGRCKICRELVCKDCVAGGNSQQKSGIICITCAKNAADAANRAKEEKRTTPEASPAPQDQIRTKPIAILIIGCFTLLCIFIYIITIPYIKTKNALQIIEFGPDTELQKAKDNLVAETGSYVLTQLEDLARNGHKNTAVRAVFALGAQPGAKAILILKQLQLDPDTPEYLNSVIIEALLEHERLYKALETSE